MNQDRKNMPYCKLGPSGHLTSGPFAEYKMALGGHMKLRNPPIISIRRVGDLIEYYMQQGNKRITFFVDLKTFETLVAAQQQVLREYERRSVPRFPSLRVIGSES